MMATTNQDQCRRTSIPATRKRRNAPCRGMRVAYCKPSYFGDAGWAIMLTFAAVPILLALVALAAILVPARAGMRVEPAVTLRAE